MRREKLFPGTWIRSGRRLQNNFLPSNLPWVFESIAADTNDKRIFSRAARAAMAARRRSGLPNYGSENKVTGKWCIIECPSEGGSKCPKGFGHYGSHFAMFRVT
jgi:hypothetical protein